MALLSTLRILVRNPAIKQISVRWSHGHKMHIQPSRYTWNQFKDYLHFYFMLGAIPLTLITAYANIFIGDAELTEIPEGYTPHQWEYYKHPITRFLAKYFAADRCLSYETTVSKMAEESEKLILHKIKKDLKMMMAEKADNKSWYYNEIDPSINRYHIELYRKTPIKTDGIPDEGLNHDYD